MTQAFTHEKSRLAEKARRTVLNEKPHDTELVSSHARCYVNG